MKEEADTQNTEKTQDSSLCSQYLSHYDAVHSWAFNSLDIVKGQLIQLCFPIFVHWYVLLKLFFLHFIISFSYIDLISKFPDEKESHAQFWSNFHDDFDVHYTDELSSLCTFVSKHQLQSTEYLEAHPFM